MSSLLLLSVVLAAVVLPSHFFRVYYICTYEIINLIQFFFFSLLFLRLLLCVPLSVMFLYCLLLLF